MVHHVKRPDSPDPAPEYTEWIQHRYDPGYWIGRVPSALRRRPGDKAADPYSVLLLVSAFVTSMLDFALGRRDTLNVTNVLVVAAFALWQFIAGIRLLRRSLKSD